MDLLLTLFNLVILITLSIFIGKNNFKDIKKKFLIILGIYSLVIIPILIFNPLLLEIPFAFGFTISLILFAYYIGKFFFVLIINKKKIKLKYNLIFLIIVFFFNIFCFARVTPPLTPEEIATRKLEEQEKNKKQKLEENLKLEKENSNLLEEEKNNLEKELDKLKDEKEKLDKDLESLKKENLKNKEKDTPKPTKPQPSKPTKPKYDFTCSKCSLEFNFGTSNYGHDADGISLCKKCFTEHQNVEENPDLEKRPSYSVDFYGVKCYAEELGSIEYSDGSIAAVVGLKSANTNYSNLKAIIIMKGTEKIYQDYYYFNSKNKNLYLDGIVFEATESYVGLDSLSNIANSDAAMLKIKLKYGSTPHVCYYKYYLY